VVIGGAYYRPYWSVGYGWGYPYYAYGYGYPYYPYYGYPYPYGFGYGVYDDTAAIRLEVTPRETQVFIDGYIAGTVDDFDGVFQRLRLPPGSHRITLYLDGYHTVTQNLYLAPGANQKVTFKLEPLSAGETAEPPPVAAEPQDQDQDQNQVEVLPQRSAPRPGQAYQGPPPQTETASRFGTLSIRVLPGDAEVFVDGERWAAPNGQDRMTVQLSEGRHHVEVRKDGFDQYQEDVLIRRGATLPLNVSLLRGTEGR